ncbi:hypothetical protein HU200_048009 [Digitaria exilis]|uniref:non-specific serine/threonine protein kinase n=1 Tax=Digitaria exilis TaxID=1010633 RepID=A0A835AWB5_9POAL|nr:hypothetical protein HU200_048009 [Digitaria exilis]
MLGSYGILAIVLVLVLPQVAISNVPSCDSGGQVGSYTANSTFQRNLDLLAATLPGNTSSAPAGFANASVGTSPDQVYALALCRGDINASSCSLLVCSEEKKSAGTLAGVLCSVVIILILSVFVFVYPRRRAKPAEVDNPGTMNKLSILFPIDDSGENALNWEQRYNIILGIAKGIMYLHEESSTRIIHRDLKANNILLDEYMDPKIADFGLAKLLGEDHTHMKTTKVVGTFGYMAPEYVTDGNVSAKIDIFSFGVLVLEIVTRRKNSSSEYHDAVNLLSDVSVDHTPLSLSFEVSLHTEMAKQHKLLLHYRKSLDNPLNYFIVFTP